MNDPLEEAIAVVAATTVTQRLHEMHFGRPLYAGALGLIPLYGRAGASLQYVPLQVALAKGTAELVEQLDAAVPVLKLHNRGEWPILITDGDELAGGRQNRLANTTLLAPAKCAFDLPVSCVEQGRWHETAPVFAAGETAYPSLRAKKVEDVGRGYQRAGAPLADQGRVWEDIAVQQRGAGTMSATHAMRDSYDQRRSELDRMMKRLPYPEDGPLGVVVTVSGHARCADIFDRPETLATYWPRLVRSYGMEALGETPTRPSLDSAFRLLNRPQRARRSGFRSPGLGIDVRFDGNGVTGAALVHEDVVVHGALFRRREKAMSGPIPF